MIFMYHSPCGNPIAKFIGKEVPQPGYRIKSRDFVLVSGKRPKPFGPIICLHCKRSVNLDEIYLGDDDAIDDVVTRLH